MAENKLNWIFELTDKVTKPIKEIVGNLGSLHQDLKKNNQEFDNVGNSINSLRKKLNRYTQARNESFRTDHIRKYNKLISVTEEKLKKLEDLPPKKHQENWSEMVLGMNQTLEVIDKLSSSLEFTSEIKKLETNIMRYTNLTGSALDNAVSKSYTLADVFDVNSEEVIRAANAMTDQIGGTFEENLNLIQKGFEKGANLNGDMLHQLSEYGPQLKEAGLSASEGLAIMAQAAKDGVYDDKAIDSIKEAGLAIREMGKSQIDALAGIGIEANDLVGKSTFESMQMISKAMQDASEQDKQRVLADVFKSAGEDAGSQFILGLAEMNPNLDAIPSIKESGQWLKEWVAESKVAISGLIGSFTPYIGILGQSATGLMSMMELSKSFGLVSKIQSVYLGLVTSAQWLWNAAMSANPIGLVIIGIAALVGAIAWLTDGFSGFGEYFTGFWEWLTEWFGSVVSFWNEYLNPFQYFFDAIEYLFPGAKSAIFDFFSSLWTGVYERFVQPFIDAWDWISSALGFGGEAPAISGEVKYTVATDNGEKSFTSNVTDKKVAKQYAGMPFGGSQSQKSTEQSSTDKSSGFASAEKKTINTKIDKLINQLIIQVPSVEMSKAKIKQIVSEALVGAIRDSEVALG